MEYRARMRPYNESADTTPARMVFAWYLRVSGNVVVGERGSGDDFGSNRMGL